MSLVTAYWGMRRCCVLGSAAGVCLFVISLVLGATHKQGHVCYLLSEGNVWILWFNPAGVPVHGRPACCVRGTLWALAWPRWDVRLGGLNLWSQHAHVVVPLWPSMPALVCFWLLGRRLLPSRDEACECGYSLKGNCSGHCPECGRLTARLRTAERLCRGSARRRSA